MINWLAQVVGSSEADADTWYGWQSSDDDLVGINVSSRGGPITVASFEGGSGLERGLALRWMVRVLVQDDLRKPVWVVGQPSNELKLMTVLPSLPTLVDPVSKST